MKTRLNLCDCLFGFVCLSIVLSDAVSAVTNNTNVSTVQVTSNLTSTSLPSFVPVQPPNPQDGKNDPELSKRRAFVVEMMKHAWNGYAKCAWGKSNFEPFACKGKSFGNLWSYSYIWDAMPTLWIMGLRDEFNRARKLIEQLNIDAVVQPKDRYVKFDTFVGSMLSCYALTGGDSFFLDRALNYTILHMKGVKEHGIPGSDDWANLVLEMYYLTHLTGNQTYRQYAQAAEQQMGEDMASMFGVLRARILHMGANFLLIKAKQYVQSNYNDSRARMRQMYRDFDAMYEKNFLHKTKSGLWYIEYFFSVDHSKDERLFRVDLCNIGATFSLGAMLMPLAQYNVNSWRLLSADQLKKVSAYWEMANNLTEMCHLGLQLTSDYMIPLHTKKNPEDKPFYRVNVSAPTISETILKYKDVGYSDVPIFDLDSYEMLESYFTLSRLTGEKKYRDYAWQMANKINQYARVPNGFISGVASEPEAINRFTDRQPPLFFTTLSYLYLMFTPDSYLPHDKFLLNAAGHPMPICGSGNPAYPNSNVKC